MQNTEFIRTDFLASIRPLLYASKLFGLTPFDFPYRCGGTSSSNKVYTATSPWNIAHSLVLILGLSCVFIPHLKFTVKHIHGDYSFSFISFEAVGRVLMFLASIVSLLQQAIFCREELKVSLLTIVRIDTHLLRKSYSGVYRKTKIILTLQLVISFTYFLTVSSFDFITVTKKYEWFHCLLMYFINAIDTVMNLQFVNFIFLIGHRFKVLNSELDSTITTSSACVNDCTSYNDGTYSVSVVEVGFDDPVGREKMAAEMVPTGNVTNTQIFTNHWLKRRLRNQGVCNIRTLRRIYMLLHSVIATVNSSFGVQIMLTTISSATITTLNIHTSIVFLTKNLGKSVKDNISKLLILNFAWTIPAVLRLITITASCEMSKNEAGRTAVLVQKLLLRRNVDTDILTELQLFSQQLLHVNTNFTASGFFALDLSFLYSILGSMATFLVFLTQVWESYVHHTHTSK